MTENTIPRMNNLTFLKSQVIEHLTEQLLNHQDIVREAWEGYRKQARAQLEEALALVEKGREFTINIRIPSPQDFTKEIERAIRMLEMSAGSHVVLSEQEFTQFVLGDWVWTDQFLTTNSLYSDSARSR